MPATTGDPSLAGLPRQLGKYTLVRRLATGGMAELFLAIQRSLGGFEKLIVIKRILPAMNQDRGFIEMLLHEARVAATLSHPNLVHVFDVGMADRAYFIAMEHVHGEDLRAIVRQMKRLGATEFPIEHALSVALGVCAGLAYAHEKRDLDGAPLDIVHRDISPQNVVVTFSGDVKIVDFGIAKSTGKLGDDTASGRLKGKVPYMSPEHARGEAVDGRERPLRCRGDPLRAQHRAATLQGGERVRDVQAHLRAGSPVPVARSPGIPAGARGHRDARALARPSRALAERARDASDSSARKTLCPLRPLRLCGPSLSRLNEMGLEGARAQPSSEPKRRAFAPLRFSLRSDGSSGGG